MPPRGLDGSIATFMLPFMTQFQKPSSTKLLFKLLQHQAKAKASNAQGFTLIELLVVVVILGVLGAVGYQATINQIGRANANTASNTATAVAKNCAGLQITGDTTAFVSTVDQFTGDNVTLFLGAYPGTPIDSGSADTTCPETDATATDGTVFGVAVGEAFCKFAEATLAPDGQVEPSPDAFENDCT